MSIETPNRPLSQHPRIADRLTEIKNSWVPVGQAETMPDRLVKSIDLFGEQPKNRDGRGVKPASVQFVARTLRHVMSAVNKVGIDNRLINHRARSLLRSLQHTRELRVTEENARRYAGVLQKTGKRIANSTPVWEAEEHSCGLMRGVGEILVRRVCSSEDLQSIGRRLELCVARRDEIGREYHIALKNRKTEFWALWLDTNPIALLSIERNEDGVRTIEEFQGKGGDSPTVTTKKGIERQLPGWLLRNLLRRVNATADYDRDFTSVGAYRSLLNKQNRNDYSDFEIEGKHYRIWFFEHEVIVAMVENHSLCAIPGKGTKWSQFINNSAASRAWRSDHEFASVWEANSSHEGAMDLEDLFELVLRSRELYDALTTSMQQSHYI